MPAAEFHPDDLMMRPGGIALRRSASGDSLRFLGRFHTTVEPRM
jgi:hypothetical protein